MTRIGLQIPNFTYPDVDAGRPVRAGGRDRRHGRAVGLRHRLRDGPLLPAAAIGPPEHEMFEAYTLLGALAARTEQRPARHARHRRDLPQPGAAGEGGHRARRHLRRPGAARHRRGVVRGGARRARLRLPAARGALRAPRGRAADLPGDVHRGAEHGRGHAPPGRRRVELAGPITPGGPPILVGGTGERRRSGSPPATPTSSTSTPRSPTCPASSTRCGPPRRARPRTRRASG